MLRKTNASLIQGATSQSGMVSALLLLSVSIGGCSADVGRFDFSSVGSTSDSGGRSALTPGEPLRRNAGIPVDTQTPGGSNRPPSGSDRTPVGGQREPEIRMSSLPDAPSREPQTRPAPAPRASAPAPAAGRQITTAATTPGETIEVQTGDTLYGIAKRHKVPVSVLMTLNNLQNPNIRPGQKLSLPAGKRPVAPRPAAVAAAPAAPVSVPAAPAAAPVLKAARAAPVAAPATPVARPVAVAAAAPADWNGSYTVAQGDSLYGIAKKHSVRAADLQSLNSIIDPTKVRPGTVLKVPGGTATASAAAPAVAASPAPVAAPVRQPATGAKPTIINAATEPTPAAAPAAAPERVAALGSNAPTKTDIAPTVATTPKAEPAVAGATGKFRWPVKGKVITGFGPRPDNTHNDGVNISVPAGTDVLAAEAGTVAYAGSELKGYGNLILVRHEGNWVSAYAHNDQLIVKRGDKVKRGQAIAKAGNTGTVDQPQVHFELRQGSKPVDPIPYMEKN